MKKYVVLCLMLGLLVFFVKNYYFNDSPIVETVKKAESNPQNNDTNNKLPSLNNSKKEQINNPFGSVSSTSTQKKKDSIEELELTGEVKSTPSLGLSKSSSAFEEQIIFENPDDLATGLIQSNDDVVINIGEYIPVPIDDIPSIDNQAGDGLSLSSEEVTNIGEAILVDDEELLRAEKEYEEYKAQNPEQFTGVNSEVELPLMPETYPTMLNKKELQAEKIIAIGEYIPVEIDLSN